MQENPSTSLNPKQPIQTCSIISITANRGDAHSMSSKLRVRCSWGFWPPAGALHEGRARHRLLEVKQQMVNLPAGSTSHGSAKSFHIYVFFLFTWEKGIGMKTCCSIKHFSTSVPCNFNSDTQQAKERERGRAMKDWVSVFEQPSRNVGIGNNRKPVSTYNTHYSAEENSSPRAISTSLKAPLSHTLLLQQNVLQQAESFQETWSQLPPYQRSHCLSQYLSHITDSCYHFLRLHELSLLTIP